MGGFRGMGDGRADLRHDPGVWSASWPTTVQVRTVTGCDGGERPAARWPRPGERWQRSAPTLSATEWALPTECPGWDVKDQLSHLIGIERAIMGEAVPEWDGPLGDHVKNDFAATNERFVAVRRALPGSAVRAEFVDVTTTRLAQLDAFDGGMGRGRLESASARCPAPSS